jgi:CheY-like chemotaxis protein
MGLVNERVLVVDDEPSAREILSSWLRDAGYEPLTASNGYDGLMLASQESPDLVVSDIVMPQMDGYEFCRMIRELTHSPIIVLTGLPESECARKSFSIGVDEFLTKPVSNRKFLSRVDGLLHGLRMSGPGMIHMMSKKTQGFAIEDQN